MSVAVGIDLGTTNSAIAFVNAHGVPEVLPNAEGDRITPSVILFENDDVVVGTYAKQAATVYPEQVVEFVKRHMGEAHYRFAYRGRDYTAEELSHFILAKLKHDAELRLGQPVERAVITVPAYFTDVQRRATLEAGRRAGLDVLALLNEPTAAAFAYGLDGKRDRGRVLVFDLGGGTFDVTLCDIREHSIDVIATRGDHQLGGKDWDDRVMDHVAQAFIDKHGTDPRTDLVALHDLRQKSTTAKISLTRRPKVNVFYDVDGNVLRVALTRETFEDLTRDLLDRCRTLTEEVLHDAGVGVDAVDTVLLAGGSTRMPMVRAMLQEMFGKEPATDINPDEAIALGASVRAAILAADRDGAAPPIDISTHDVTSHSLGLAVLRDGALMNARVLPRNTRIPAERTLDDVVTTFNDQTAVDLWLVQGEADDPLGCTILGHFEFYGIPARPAGQTRLSVTYRYDADAIVEVEAMDLATGQILPFRAAAGGPSLDDLAAGRTPHQVMAVVDCSGSMYGEGLESARKVLRDLTTRLLEKPLQEIGVVAFPGGVRQLPTGDAKRLYRVADDLVAVGRSRLAETLEQSLDAVLPAAGISRTVVILSDGRISDAPAARETLERIRNAGARVATVAVGTDPVADVLRGLASSPNEAVHRAEDLTLHSGRSNLATWAPQGG